MKSSRSFGYLMCSLLAIVLTLVIPSGCSISSGVVGPLDLDITGMNISQSTCSLAVNADIQLRATVTPASASGVSLLWSSSDPAIATVTNAGLVHGAAAGSATIKAEAGTFSATCLVTVVDNMISVTSISISPESLNITHPSSSQIVATVLPANATDKSVSYSSSDPAVVTLNEMGMITTVGAGSATVTARTNNGGFADICLVTVSLPNVAVTSVTLSPAHLSLVHPASQQLTAQVIPVNATDTAVAFVSSNTSVATVNSTGMVSSVAAGNAVITATTHDGNFTATTTVTVSFSLVAIASISLNQASLTLTHPATGQLLATILPANATDKTVTFASSDALVTSVDSSGTVTTTGGGTTTITATASDGTHTAQCLVTVIAPVTSVTLAQTSLSLVHPSSEQLVASIQPPSATNKAVSFVSSDPAIATVSASGLVTTVAAGNTAITVTTNDGNHVARCDLVVTMARVPVASVSLDRASIELAYPSNVSLVATVLPANASTKDVVFTSADTAVATVDATGNVITVGPGSTYITVTTVESSFTDTCLVTVTMPVTGISLAPNSLSLVHPATQLLIATVTPANASNRTVSYSSSDPAVATVSALGMVTTVGSGVATITVTTQDGSLTDNCLVTVSIPISSVTLSTTYIDLEHPQTYQLVVTVLPANATNKAVTYSSSDPSVVTVSNTGLLTTVGNGNATISVIAVDGGLGAICSVFVTTPVTAVSLFPHNLSLLLPEQGQLIASVEPSTASSNGVRFSSSAPVIVNVDSAGHLYTIAAGTAIITVTTDDGNFTDTCTVTVTTPAVAVTGVNLSPSTLALRYPETAQLLPSIEPANATNLAVSYLSSNPVVATVSETGLVTSISGGSAIVSVATADGNFIDYCSVTVSMPVASISLSPGTLALVHPATSQLVATVLPANATNKTVNYTSSAPAVATVSATGLVTTVGGGTATITATSDDGSYTATCVVTVTIPVASISVAPTTLTLSHPATSQLTSTVLPATATNKAVTYTSSAPAVATVSATGLVTTVGGGTATVTATTIDGSFTATSMVTVAMPVTSITLSPGTISINTSQTSQLTATVLPANANNKTVTWTTSAAGIVTVSNAGLVSPVAPGTATITATTVDGGFTATCTVTVTAIAVTSVTVSPLTGTISCTGTIQLIATVLPANATNKAVTWSKTGTMATVSQTGLVSGIAYTSGLSYVKVTTVDGGKTATAAITVTYP